ncbi:PREDICTED: uncharacterized protein LOC106807253 [Priapulus caudatus]|uniref:Uncharacterized protein LOC106807253 n=1 Tax=Priapulus caudatus TaxID=37621 RepID=A0ABM1DYL1_PRICU|nr:PREDICTED: uncharacterized protein LOC106807253 [Priapulus caudatus]
MTRTMSIMDASRKMATKQQNWSPNKQEKFVGLNRLKAQMSSPDKDDAEFATEEELQTYLLSMYNKALVNDSDCPLSQHAHAIVATAANFIERGKTLDQESCLKTLLCETMLKPKSILVQQPGTGLLVEYRLQALLRLELAAMKVVQPSSKSNEDTDGVVKEFTSFIRALCFCNPDFKLASFLNDEVLPCYLSALPELLVDIYDDLGQPLPSQLAEYASPNKVVNSQIDDEPKSITSSVDPLSANSFHSAFSWESQPRSMPTTRSRSFVRNPSLMESSQRQIAIPRRAHTNKERMRKDTLKQRSSSLSVIEKKGDRKNEKKVRRNLIGELASEMRKPSPRKMPNVTPKKTPCRSSGAQHTLKTRLVSDTPRHRQVGRVVWNRLERQRKRTNTLPEALVVEESPEKPLLHASPKKMAVLKCHSSFYSQSSRSRSCTIAEQSAVADAAMTLCTEAGGTGIQESPMKTNKESQNESVVAQDARWQLRRKSAADFLFTSLSPTRKRKAIGASHSRKGKSYYTEVLPTRNSSVQQSHQEIVRVRGKLFVSPDKNMGSLARAELFGSSKCKLDSSIVGSCPDNGLKESSALDPVGPMLYLLTPSKCTRSKSIVSPKENLSLPPRSRSMEGSSPILSNNRNVSVAKSDKIISARARLFFSPSKLPHLENTQIGDISDSTDRAVFNDISTLAAASWEQPVLTRRSKSRQKAMCEISTKQLPSHSTSHSIASETAFYTDHDSPRSFMNAETDFEDMPHVTHRSSRMHESVSTDEEQCSTVNSEYQSYLLQAKVDQTPAWNKHESNTVTPERRKSLCGENKTPETLSDHWPKRKHRWTTPTPKSRPSSAEVTPQKVLSTSSGCCDQPSDSYKCPVLRGSVSKSPRTRKTTKDQEKDYMGISFPKFENLGYDLKDEEFSLLLCDKILSPGRSKATLAAEMQTAVTNACVEQATTDKEGKEDSIIMSKTQKAEARTYSDHVKQGDSIFAESNGVHVSKVPTNTSQVSSSSQRIRKVSFSTKCSGRKTAVQALIPMRFTRNLSRETMITPAEYHMLSLRSPCKNSMSQVLSPCASLVSTLSHVGSGGVKRCSDDAGFGSPCTKRTRCRRGSATRLSNNSSMQSPLTSSSRDTEVDVAVEQDDVFLSDSVLSSHSPPLLSKIEARSSISRHQSCNEVVIDTLSESQMKWQAAETLKPVCEMQVLSCTPPTGSTVTPKAYYSKFSSPSQLSVRHLTRSPMLSNLRGRKLPSDT